MNISVIQKIAYNAILKAKAEEIILSFSTRSRVQKIVKDEDQYETQRSYYNIVTVRPHDIGNINFTIAAIKFLISRLQQENISVDIKASHLQPELIAKNTIEADWETLRPYRVAKSASLSFGGLDSQVKDIIDCLKELYKIISAKYTAITRMDIRDYVLEVGMEPVNVAVSFVVDDYKAMKEHEEELGDIAAEFGFEFKLEQTRFELIKRNT
jgi:hypothetical protein